MPRSKYDKSMKRIFFLLSDDTLTESNKSFRQQHIVNDLEKTRVNGVHTNNNNKRRSFFKEEEQIVRHFFFETKETK